MKTAAKPLAYLLWISQIVGLCIYTIMVLNQPPDATPQGDFSIDTLFMTLALVSAGIALWTFFIRWLFKGFLIGSGRIRSSFWVWLLYLLTGFLIWIPSGGVAIYGLILFFVNQVHFLYFVFATISLVLLLCHFPLFLSPSKQIHSQRDNTSNPEDPV